MVEVVAVMVIMSVMVSVGVKKLDLVSLAAADRVLERGIKELNTRETLVWTQLKLSDSGGFDDSEVFTEMNTDLGPEFQWTERPNITGGTLRFRSQSIALIRTESSSSSVGSWN